MTRGTGRGKVILFGEHAVVHGHPALAGALAVGVTVEVGPAERTRVEVPAWDVATQDGPVVEAVGRISAALGGGGWLVRGEADVPARAGLGSSAAFAVAVTRAIAAARDADLAPAEVERIANQAERTFHGQPSGVDVALAARGGIGLYTRSHGFEPIGAAPALRLAIGLSGEPRDTAARVADVAARLRADPGVIGRRLAALGELALLGREAVMAGDGARLGALFERAHEELAALGLSTPGLERLRALAREAGAAGAKLTGAGGGGAVIATGAEARVVAAWRAAGFAAFVAEVGA